jgi:hypothetical protein
MVFPRDEIEEVKALFGPVEVGNEGSLPYLRFRGVHLPQGCQPERCDLLLCPTDRDGYASRLFFSAEVSGNQQRSWTRYRILEGDWYAYSWKDGGQKRLAQKMAAHLEALK